MKKDKVYIKESFCMKNTKYVYGRLGSLLMECPGCKKRQYRSAIKVLHFQRKEYCAWCSDSELTPLTIEETA